VRIVRDLLRPLPMNIDMPSVIDALRMIAVERKGRIPEGNMPLMNRLLLGTIRTFGRTYDLGVMALYKMRTSTYMKDTAKFPMILAKRKISLLPRKARTKKP
jgi:heterodisulfide reductase subunit C